MQYFIKRLLFSIPLLIGITFVSFIIMKSAPGDPTAMYFDPSSNIQDMAVIQHNLGLDQPLHIQYVKWLSQAVQGNLGYSYATKKPVTSMILERLPATLLLSITSLIIILAITLPLGLLSGYKKDSLFDTIVTFSTFIGLSLPTFWLGLMLILLFSLKLNLLPTSGIMDPYLFNASLFTKALNIVSHMILPLLTIIIGGTAALTRYHRFGIIHILQQDYVKAARARGISETRLLFKHAFKNSALPIVTILGLSLPGLISGSYVIEYIFSWPGMGQLGINAVFQRDYPILMGSLLFSSILILAGNLITDFCYALVDPRISKK